MCARRRLGSSVQWLHHCGSDILPKMRLENIHTKLFTCEMALPPWRPQEVKINRRKEA